MQSENRFFEDLAKMMNGFAGTMAGVGREAESNAREKFKGWIGGSRAGVRLRRDRTKRDRSSSTTRACPR